MNDMPIGFVMSLALNENAMNYFATLDDTTRYNIKSYIQNCNTGTEAKEKINTVINNLANNSIDFLENFKIK